MAELRIDDISKVKETEKAIGVPITNGNTEKMCWCPKSQIQNRETWQTDGCVGIPDWLYDAKINELFPGAND